jgi:D-serine dehydratase
VWTCVQSRPEAGLAIAAAGKRDLSYDVNLPIPELWHRPGEGEMPRPVPEGCRVTALNDQHAYISVPDGFDLRVGDLIGFGISHPCTTFDKWRLLYVVDDEYRILDAVRTYF